MEDQKIWDKTAVLIKDHISSNNFRAWFKKIGFKKTLQKGSIGSEGVFEVTVPSAFNKNQLIQRYDQLIKDSLEKVIGLPVNVIYGVDPSLEDSFEENIKDDLFAPQTFINQSANQLNKRYTLDNFVVGLTNNLAFAAAKAVIENPGTSYNPLFIYGHSGVGKTHLMQGIGNELLKKDPYRKLVYASLERFTVDLVDAIQNKKTGDFRHKYRSTDILLIDDVQFISGKDSTQEEFFHTFNELYAKNCQIVLTSDRPPYEILKLESRLASRFQGGLMVDIQLPDLETRMAILKEKLKEKQESLPEEILQKIAETVDSNTRELEGKLIQVLQLLKHLGKEPTLDLVKDFLGKKVTQTALDYKKVLLEINSYFNIKMGDLIGPRRQKELVLPRQIAMMILYEDCKIPMEKIGKILGGRDHTTVLYGIDKMKQLVERDREIQKVVMDLKQQLL